MDTNTTNYRKRGIILFAVGTLIGVLLAAGAIWADLEASFYGFSKLTNERLNTLSCPAYMTKNETAAISMRLTNSTDRTVNQLVRAQFSTPLQIVTVDEAREMQPGASKSFAWSVTEDNVDLGFFVFANVYRFATYPIPAQQSMCGIFVVNIPFITGLQFVLLMGALSVVGMGIGWWFWEKGNKPLRDHALDAARAMKFMSILVTVTMVVSMLGSWIMAGLLLVVCILMIFITLRFFVQS